MSEDASYDERVDPVTRQARTSAGEAAVPGLARQLSELARDLQAAPDEAAGQQRIVDAAVAEIDGADAASIMLVQHGTAKTTVSTDQWVVDADAAQHEAGDGPCLTSLREESTVRADDLEGEQRWPRFAQAALALGVRSMLSLQLFVEADNLGSLNIYSRRPGAFDDVAESTGMLLASHAAIAMKGARTEHNLRIALEHRDVIGQAKGILMERFRVSAPQAFDMLVLLSQRSQRKLRDLADDIAATGDIPSI